MKHEAFARTGLVALCLLLAACGGGPGADPSPAAPADGGAADLSSSKPYATSLTTGTAAVSLRPKFYWSAIEAAESYDLYLSTASTAGEAPLVSGIAGSPYALATDLAGGTKYYWKVVARNSVSSSQPSSIQSFTTDKEGGFAAPAYSSPADGYALYPLSGFSWGAVAGATNYRFLFSTAPDASGYIKWEKGTSLSDPASGYFFTPGLTWYWKVVAEDAATCSSDKSPVWSFTPADGGIAAPAGVSVDASYKITWSAVAGASKYVVLLNYGGTDFRYDSLAYFVSSGTSYDASGLSAGKTIGYAVAALDSAGHTSYAASVAAAKTFVR